MGNEDRYYKLSGNVCNISKIKNHKKEEVDFMYIGERVGI